MPTPHPRLARALLRCGGIASVLLMVFHLFLGRILGWEEGLQVLSPIDRATMITFNTVVTGVLLYFAYLTFVRTEAFLQSALGRSVAKGIAGFFLLRALCQPLVYGAIDLRGAVIIASMVLFAALYLLPLALTRPMRAPSKGHEHARSA